MNDCVKYPKTTFEYDFRAEAGYLALKEIKPRGIAISREADVSVVLDFDKDGKLVGFGLHGLGIKRSEIDNAITGEG